MGGKGWGVIGGCCKGLLQGNSRYGWAWYSFYQNLLQERGVGRVGAATRDGKAGNQGDGEKISSLNFENAYQRTNLVILQHLRKILQHHGMAGNGSPIT